MICSFPNYPFQSPRELQNENIGAPSCPSDKEEQKDSMFFEKEIVNYPSADDVVVPSGDIIWPESTGFLKRGCSAIGSLLSVRDMLGYL